MRTQYDTTPEKPLVGSPFRGYRAAGFGGWFVTHRQGFIPATTQKGKYTMKKMIGGGLAAAAVAGAIGAGVLAAPQAKAAFAFAICPSGHTGVVGGTPTSCPFADNVRAAWFSQTGNPVVAWSPVTEQYYSMACAPGVATVSGIVVNGWTCFGGNNAEVVIW